MIEKVELMRDPIEHIITSVVLICVLLSVEDDDDYDYEDVDDD